MTLRSALTISSCLLLLFTSGCASRYQDLLRDKDMEIRELQARLADANAEIDSLRDVPAPQTQIAEAGLDPELARHLASRFEAPNKRLYELLGEDLGWASA